MTKTGKSYQIFNHNLTKFCVLQKTKWKIIFIIYDKYQSIPITTREKNSQKSKKYNTFIPCPCKRQVTPIFCFLSCLFLCVTAKILVNQ